MNEIKQSISDTVKIIINSFLQYNFPSISRSSLTI